MYLSMAEVIAMTSLSRSPKILDGYTTSKRHRRQNLQTCSGNKKSHKKIGATRSRSNRDQFCLAVALSITILVLSANEAPILANAFVQNNTPHYVQRHAMLGKNMHIRQLPLLPHRSVSPLSAKKGSTEKEDSKNESSFGFFNRKDKVDDPKRMGKKAEEDGKSKDLPVVGRFFASEEEKEEKKRLKQKESEEKERLKQQAKAEKEKRKIEAKKERQRRERESSKDEVVDDEKKANVVTGVKNYFRERQIRKDSEVLRFQILRKEELRQKQLEKDAEELRLAVQQREKERRQNQAKIKVPTVPLVPQTGSAPTEDIVRKKIQTQKEIDLARKERQERLRAKEKSDRDDKKESSSKSQRLGGVVSAAQKFVSGVFDGKAEQWIVVAPKTRIAPGEILPITAAGIDLLLVASKDGSAVHCVANSCPHLGTPLEVGSLERLPIESKTNPPAPGGKVQPLERKDSNFFQENDIANMLKQDGCEDCIVCPLHKTAFALQSGEVRGEWCPYPPVIGKLTGAIKTQANLPVFDVRIKGKNIEVRLNTPVEINDGSSSKKEKKKW